MTTPEKPAANKTSEVIDELLKCSHAFIQINDKNYNVLAICERAKRMEEALNKIAAWTDTSGHLDEPYSAEQAREALAFDPLAND